MNNKTLYAKSVLAASIIMATSSLCAQEFELEEVVVTAQKRSESLQDVPIAVSAFAGDALTDYGVTGLKAVQMVTPGLVMNNSGAIAQPYLRGVGTRFANMGLEPSIATYIDDRYISRPTATLFELADVERVEVLKGPQGTLYGRNAAGGAMRVITKAPADEFEGTITANVGNYSHRGVSGTVSVPLSDTVSTRFSGIIKQRDGYADNLSPEGVSELDDQDFEAYRAKLKWDMTDQSTMLLTLAYLNQDDNNGNDVVALPPYDKNKGLVDKGGVTGSSPDEVATAIGNTIQNQELSSQLRFDIGFDAFDFASVTTYSKWDSERNSDADGTSGVSLDLPEAFEDAETYSQEFQVLSNGDGAWEWMGGLFFFHQEGTSLMLVDAGIPKLVSLTKQSVETDAWSLFGQTTWHMDEQWSLTLGARWNDEEKALKQTDDPQYITTASARGLLPYEDGDSWSEFTPKVTLEYGFDTGMTYLTYSRGFKSGGFNYPAAGKNPLEPEILDMYELGVKADLLADRLRLNATLFYYDYQDLQVTRAAAGSDGSLQITTENAANAEVLGLEADITWLANERLTINAGVGLLESEYKDYDANAKLVNEATAGLRDVLYDASGESMLRAPDFSAYLSAKYEFQLGEANVPLVLTYSYKGEYEFDFVASKETEAMTQDAFGLLNARISYNPPSDNWSLSLWANNVTDEEYFDDIVGNAAGIRGSYGAPRTFGVDAVYNF